MSKRLLWMENTCCQWNYADHEVCSRILMVIEKSGKICKEKRACDMIGVTTEAGKNWNRSTEWGTRSKYSKQNTAHKRNTITKM